AHYDVEAPRGVYCWPGSCPDATHARGRNLVGAQRSLSVRTRGNYPSVVVAAIAVQAAERSVHHALVQRKRGPLLLCLWIYSVRVHKAAHLHLAGVYIGTYQDVFGSAD